MVERPAGQHIDLRVSRAVARGSRWQGRLCCGPMNKSTTRVGHPARVFRYSDEDEKKMQVQFARICVLYDDLMLEYAGAEIENIKTLDGSGRDARRFYFVRRQLRYVLRDARRRGCAERQQGVSAAAQGRMVEGPSAGLEQVGRVLRAESCVPEELAQRHRRALSRQRRRSPSTTSRPTRSVRSRYTGAERVPTCG